MSKNIFIVFFILIVVIVGCKNKQHDTYTYPSGNAVHDYFYKKGYAFPFYCDSMKPICKIEDSIKSFGKYQQQRKLLALQACRIITDKFKIDSLRNKDVEAFAVFPVFVYFIDSPIVWYRVVFKEYKNNIEKTKITNGNWQLTDSNRILVSYHNLEFQINEDGSLEYKCDQM